MLFFKQKTAYEMRIRYWSSDVCSSDLLPIQSVLHLSGIDRGGAARLPPRQPFGALRDRVVQGKPRRGGRARQLRARLRRARDHEGGADSGWLTQGAEIGRAHV